MSLNMVFLATRMYRFLSLCCFHWESFLFRSNTGNRKSPASSEGNTANVETGLSKESSNEGIENVICVKPIELLGLTLAMPKRVVSLAVRGC
jgi:hypothetical protein